ncbi:AraC family transcriptional regulator [Hamadaea tsunoensis]|uniref:AraC family transcriptional regulator n=1 Tax=Hamadaea tsunoensis TaxID=53368 RepID=UPI000418A76B|nr:AraC family transcriptional regulator [Hamadaea tsunoensis]
MITATVDRGAADRLRAAVPDRIEGHPVGNTDNRMYFADGSLIYAGGYRHDGNFGVHTHSFMEIAFAVAGRGTHHASVGRQDMRRGDVVLLRPGVWHGYEACSQLDLINCCISMEILRSELSWMRHDPILSYLLWTGPHAQQRRGMLTVTLPPPVLDECLGHLQALDELRSRPATRYRADTLARLSLVLAALARAVVDADDAGYEPTGPTHPSVVEAMKLLERDVARRWTLDELAEVLHLAPGYLVRLFKAATGLPPIAYLSRQRMETAAAMLLYTDEPISHIADAIGWPDQNYFARRFKAHFGLPASVYRDRFRHDGGQLRTHRQLTAPRPHGHPALRELTALS